MGLAIPMIAEYATKFKWFFTIETPNYLKSQKRKQPAGVYPLAGWL
jgi:hypothetical protein